jgi:hypothetical protein
MALVKGTEKRVSADYHDIEKVKKTPKPPSRSIDEFKAVLSKGSGMARAAKYEVVLYPPNALAMHIGQGEFATDITPYTRQISLLCDTVAMPGHDLQTHSAKYGTGLATMMVDGHGFEGTIATTFYMDENLETKSYFELWQHMAVNKDTNKVSYYKDENGNPNYAGTMEIYQLGGGGRTHGMEVLEVYPETIGQIEYAYATVDTLALLPIEFQYKKWKTIDPRKLGGTDKSKVQTPSRLPKENGVNFTPKGIAKGLGFESEAALKDYMRGLTHGGL